MTIRKPLLYLAFGSLLITQTGCFGSFNLTSKLYDWNDTAVSDRFLKSLLFVGLCIVPVYEICLLADAVVFNLIEFWSGSNPITMNEDESEMQLVTMDGVDYRIVATKDTFTTTQLSGAEAGTVRVLAFDRETLTWNYSDAKVCDQPVLTFTDDQAEHVRVHTATGYADMSVSELQNTDLAVAKLSASAAMAKAN